VTTLYRRTCVAAFLAFVVALCVVAIAREHVSSVGTSPGSLRGAQTQTRGSVSGRVLTENGAPVASAVVLALTPELLGGIVRYQVAGRADTDAGGRYRITRLLPDHYSVLACPRSFCEAPGTNTAPAGWAPTFYPAAAGSGRAPRVTVETNAELPFVDITVRQQPTYEVAGTVLRRDGSPITTLPVMLFPGADVTIPVSASTWTKPDGTFVFRDVPAGPYVLETGAVIDKHPDLFAIAVVIVPFREAVTLRADEGSMLRGEVTFEGAAPRPGTADVILLARPVDFTRSPVGAALGGGMRLKDDWTFEAGPLWGPRLIDLSKPPPGWALDRVEVDGRPSPDRRVDAGAPGTHEPRVRVVVTREWPSLTGTAVVRPDAPAAHVDVLAFTVDEADWEALSPLVRRVRTDERGHFVLTSLPDGDYWVVAVDEAPSDRWRWARFDVLEDLKAHATRVTVSRSQPGDLRLVVQRFRG
jgi:hypothetical protein